MRTALLFTTILALTVCLIGCGRGTHTTVPSEMPSPGKPVTKLPASREVMNTHVTMKKAYRVGAGAVKMEILVTKSKRDPVAFTFGGPLEVKPQQQHAVQGSVVGRADGSAMEYPVCELPPAGRYITVSYPVIEHDADLVKFPVFSSGHLPLTRHMGTHYVTVKSMRTETDYDNPKNTDLVMELELPPGYAPHHVKIRDDRGRELPMSGTAYSTPGKDPTTVWLRPIMTGRWRPRPVSLELLSAKEKKRWVTFDNVPVPPLTHRRTP